MTPTLRGDRCQCSACHLYFKSSHAHAAHRVGKHGEDRRCLNTEELRAKGYAPNEAGFWRQPRADRPT